MALKTPLLKDEVWSAVRTVLDPETHLSIVEMGLVYDVAVDVAASRIRITYTLTTPLCPLAETIQSLVREAVRAAGLSDHPETDVILELVFEPVWTLARLTPAARAELGM